MRRNIIGRCSAHGFPRVSNRRTGSTRVFDGCSAYKPLRRSNSRENPCADQKPVKPVRLSLINIIMAKFCAERSWFGIIRMPQVSQLPGSILANHTDMKKRDTMKSNTKIIPCQRRSEDHEAECVCSFPIHNVPLPAYRTKHSYAISA